MDSIRYFIALIVLISIPPGIILWFVIHPFASFWRKLGPGWTYGLLGVPIAILMMGVFLGRDHLLATDFGTSYPLIALAVLCMAGGITIGMKRKKYLTFGILAGLPEISEQRYPGKLLNEGIYARIRHPRYVEAIIGVLGYAFFANFLASYILFIVSIPALYLVVFLEERELRERFGEEYEEYCRKVPRFVPNISNGS